MAGIRIGTAERGGTFHGQALALKVVLDRVPSLAPVAVLETPAASIGNAEGLDAGEIDFGFMAANWVGRAVRGEAPFARPIDLRTAAPMNVGPLFFIARAGSALRTVDDLRGRRVVVGAPGSGMVQHAHVVLAALGLAMADIEPVRLDFAAGADALAAGTVDAQFQCPIPNAVMTALSERADVRVLEFPADRLARVLAAVPYYRRAMMRAGAFRGLDGDTMQIGVLNVLATHARMPEAIVGAVAGAIAAGAAELGRLNPLFDGLSDLLAATDAHDVGGVAWRAGAAPDRG